MVDPISNIVSDKQDIKNQLGDLPDVTPIYKRFTDVVAPKVVATKGVTKTYDGSTNVFILNSGAYGILGTNKLGDSASTSALYSVVSPANTFVDYFGQDLFIDTSASDGTLTTGSLKYDLLTGETLQSEVIAKIRAPIATAKILDNSGFVSGDTSGMILPFTLGVDEFGSSSISLYLSNDSGSTWQQVYEDGLCTFPTSATTDELKYKIVAGATITIDTPLIITYNQ